MRTRQIFAKVSNRSRAESGDASHEISRSMCESSSRHSCQIARGVWFVCLGIPCHVTTSKPNTTAVAPDIAGRYRRGGWKVSNLRYTVPFHISTERFGPSLEGREAWGWNTVVTGFDLLVATGKKTNEMMGNQALLVHESDLRKPVKRRSFVPIKRGSQILENYSSVISVDREGSAVTCGLSWHETSDEGNMVFRVPFLMVCKEISECWELVSCVWVFCRNPKCRLSCLGKLSIISGRRERTVEIAGSSTYMQVISFFLLTIVYPVPNVTQALNSQSCWHLTHHERLELYVLLLEYYPIQFDPLHSSPGCTIRFIMMSSSFRISLLRLSLPGAVSLPAAARPSEPGGLPRVVDVHVVLLQIQSSLLYHCSFACRVSLEY